WSLLSTNAWRTPMSSAEAEELVGQAKTGPPEASGFEALSSRSLSSRPDQCEFEAAVSRIVATIHSGDILQTNLCRRIETSLPPGMEWDLYRRMRSISHARYEAFLRIGDERAVLSISPEMFLRLDRDIVESSPIKGTRPRARTAEEDHALSRELL